METTLQRHSPRMRYEVESNLRFVPTNHGVTSVRSLWSFVLAVFDSPDEWRDDEK